VIPPVLTPFRLDRSIDYAAWERLVAWLIERKVDALFVGGGSGEWSFLTPEERVELTRRAATVASREVPIVSNSLGGDFEETLSLSRRMVDAGADFLGIVIPRFVQPGTPASLPPFYERDTAAEIPFTAFDSTLQEPIYAFFHRLSETFPFPIMLYDPPGSGEYGLQPLWLRRLSGLKSIVALKKTTRDLRLFSQLIEAAGEGFAVIAGDETVMLPCLAVGAVGCIGGGANMFPELMLRLYDAHGKGDLELARAAHYAIERANRLVERVGWPLAGKIALQARDLPVEPVTRIEMPGVRSEDHRQLVAYFRQERYLA
jgi:4-hydroxy-tetrahydrodipicolinate synthase